MNKLLLSASALAFGLAISGAALAASTNNSTNTTTTQADNNQLLSPNHDGNGNNLGSPNNNTVASDNNLLSPHDNTTSVDTGNTQPIASDNTIASDDGGNTSTHTTSLSLSSTTTTSIGFEGPVTLQVLTDDAVGGDLHGASGGLGGSGAVTLGGADSQSQFSGIQTASVNTGLQASAQAATAVAATTSVSFGANGTTP